MHDIPGGNKSLSRGEKRRAGKTFRGDYRAKQGERAVNEIKGIICHWSASGHHTKVEDIRRWHREKGMRDIGYHRVIEHQMVNKFPEDSMKLVKTGRVLNLDLTLNELEIGAHTYGFNREYIGICVVGSPKEPPSALQLAALEKTLGILCRRYGLKNTDVYGHRQMKGHESNQCPGEEVLKVVKAFRNK